MKVISLGCALMLAACSSGAGHGRSGGLATYDDLRAAQERCVDRGGTLRLKRNGDAKYLDDYACETK
ncbi:MAG: hypothetical protein U1C74_16355 [Phenylobacterium sp.]|nr:hypothetical protein [Phenylobacterium sp.]